MNKYKGIKKFFREDLSGLTDKEIACICYEAYERIVKENLHFEVVSKYIDGISQEYISEIDGNPSYAIYLKVPRRAKRVDFFHIEVTKMLLLNVCGCYRLLDEVPIND